MSAETIQQTAPKPVQQAVFPNRLPAQELPLSPGAERVLLVSAIGISLLAGVALYVYSQQPSEQEIKAQARKNLEAQIAVDMKRLETPIRSFLACVRRGSKDPDSALFEFMNYPPMPQGNDFTIRIEKTLRDYSGARGKVFGAEIGTTKYQVTINANPTDGNVKPDPFLRGNIADPLAESALRTCLGPG